MQQSKITRFDAKVKATLLLIDNFLMISVLYFVALHTMGEWNSTLSLLLVMLIIFNNFFSESQHVYRIWRTGSISEAITIVLVSWTTALFLVILTNTFFLKELIISDQFWLYSFFLVPALIITFHILLRGILRWLRDRGHNVCTVAIYGATPLGERLKSSIEDMPWSRMHIVGFYDDRRKRGPGRRTDVEVLGSAEDLLQVCKKGEVERVYITLSLMAENRSKMIIKSLADTTVSVYLVPDMFTYDLLHSRIEDYRGIPAVSIYESPFSGVDALLKRLEDIIVGSLILLLIAIPMLIIAIGVKLSSPGPVIFKQKRYGLDGKQIEVWKFRSMTVMENSDVVVQAKKNDVRVTPFGGFLRRTSLDELPQFINVVQGRMSIVGPRPHAVSHNEQYRKLISGYMLRHKIKPGITGLAQINGFRGETDTLEKMEKRVEYDLNYMRNWSVFLDLKVIFLTVFKGFVDKNAY